MKRPLRSRHNGDDRDQSSALRPRLTSPAPDNERADVQNGDVRNGKESVGAAIGRSKLSSLDANSLLSFVRGRPLVVPSAAPSSADTERGAREKDREEQLRRLLHTLCGGADPAITCEQTAGAATAIDQHTAVHVETLDQAAAALAALAAAAVVDAAPVGPALGVGGGGDVTGSRQPSC